MTFSVIVALFCGSSLNVTALCASATTDSSWPITGAESFATNEVSSLWPLRHAGPASSSPAPHFSSESLSCCGVADAASSRLPFADLFLLLFPKNLRLFFLGIGRRLIAARNRKRSHPLFFNYINILKKCSTAHKGDANENQSRSFVIQINNSIATKTAPLFRAFGVCRWFFALRCHNKSK